MVPGMTAIILTYGQWGSVGCSSRLTVDPSAWDDSTCHPLSDAASPNARVAYSFLIDWYAAAN